MMEYNPQRTLKELNRHAKKSFGQNFLISSKVIRSIIDAVHPQERDSILEIGPGLGALTIPLHQKSMEYRFCCVELDRDLVSYWQENCPDLELYHEDALRVDWNDILGEGEGTWKIVSNLPYNVGTPILSRLLVQPQVKELVVMMQKEVIERLLARPNERKRGSLTCWVEAFADVTLVTRVPRGAFFPAPKVESAVVKLVCKDNPLLPYAQSDVFETFLRKLFVQPRKKARNNLSDLKAHSNLPQDIEDLIQLRPFQLSLADVLTLFHFHNSFLS
jgi:16S rRNA (adenine1518-N6/adenine1519-N6)-dimethyltransferase